MSRKLTGSGLLVASAPVDQASDEDVALLGDMSHTAVGMSEQREGGDSPDAHGITDFKFTTPEIASRGVKNIRKSMA